MSVQVRSKYGAKPTVVDGVRFASKAEAARFRQLRLLEVTGRIFDLRLQPRYELQPAFVDNQGRRWSAIRYSADFAYREPGNPREVVEDVKGARPAVFRLKERLFRFRYPNIDFRVVGA